MLSMFVDDKSIGISVEFFKREGASLLLVDFVYCVSENLQGFLNLLVTHHLVLQFVALVVGPTHSGKIINNKLIHSLN
jgi:hypothetical protein